MKNKKIIKKLLEEIAIKVAIADANATCPCINYQPKIPKAVKKLRIRANIARRTRRNYQIWHEKRKSYHC